MKKIVKTAKSAYAVVGSFFDELSLARYGSLPSCKREILKILDGRNVNDDLLLRQVVQSIKRKIQWPYIYLPLIVLGFLALVFVRAGLSLPVLKYQITAILAILVLAMVFRFTFLSEFLEISRRLMLAAADLSAEGIVRSRRETERLGKRSPVVRNESPTQANEELLEGDEEPAIYGEDLIPLFKGNANGLKKGAIHLFLLDQLLRKECGKPCIHDGDIYINITNSAHISGCKPKNIITQSPSYRSRQKINPKTSNRKSTLLRYLEILQHFYKETDDLPLQERAKDLYHFVDFLKISAKMQ